jgi:hypothetical protein
VTGIIPITTTSTNFPTISCPVWYSPALSPNFILSKKKLAYWRTTVLEQVGMDLLKVFNYGIEVLL